MSEKQIEALAHALDKHWLTYDKDVPRAFYCGGPDCGPEGDLTGFSGNQDFQEHAFHRHVARAVLQEPLAQAWDEGYALDWTGGVKHGNPYRGEPERIKP